MADAILTRATIVNWALSDLGMSPNFSDDSQTDMGRLVDIFWPRCQARAFGLHDWSFCRRTRRLTRRAEKPENGFAYGFELPGDRYGPPLKLLSDPSRNVPLRDVAIEGDTVFANEPAVWARIKSAVPIDAWPPQFTDGFALLLASYLALPLLQDEDLAAVKMAAAIGGASEGGAGGLFGRLIAQDRAGEPLGAPQSRSDPLTLGRAAGGRWW